MCERYHQNACTISREQVGIAVETVSFMGLEGKSNQPKKLTLYSIALFMPSIIALSPTILQHHNLQLTNLQPSTN
ncbi:MAG: hypothetical protein F6K46_37615 [Moorea sp. SIO3E8]|nr:hypothetical protein [Moorena sp. SIO3E8]